MKIPAAGIVAALALAVALAGCASTASTATKTEKLCPDSLVAHYVGSGTSAVKADVLPEIAKTVTPYCYVGLTNGSHLGGLLVYQGGTTVQSAVVAALLANGFTQGTTPGDPTSQDPTQTQPETFYAKDTRAVFVHYAGVLTKNSDIPDLVGKEAVLVEVADTQ